jgi:large subunit ribosomal protein L5
MGKKELYEKEVKPKLIKEFGLTSPEAAPKITKIVVNMGTGEILKDKSAREALIADMATICGQKPSVRKARISVAGFGIREGNPVGLTVTLRGKRMFDFYDKLVSITLPRLRDFRGVRRSSFDKHGNFTIGLSEYSVFAEIDIAKVARAHGIEITIVTSTNDKAQAERLLELMGMPFEKEEKPPAKS